MVRRSVRFHSKPVLRDGLCFTFPERFLFSTLINSTHEQYMCDGVLICCKIYTPCNLLPGMHMRSD